MCRSLVEDPRFRGRRECLQVQQFQIRLAVPKAERRLLPSTLTLMYIPRNGDSILEVNGQAIRPEAGAFIALERREDGEGTACFGSSEKVRASEGVSFEVYAWEERVLSGSFWREEGAWRTRSRCEMEAPLGFDVAEAEVWVTELGRGTDAMKERVEMRKSEWRRRRRATTALEDIPEGEWEGEGEVWEEGLWKKEEMWDCEEKEMEVEEEMRWLDVGFVAVCVGVGFLASAAATKRLRRRFF
ncbi:Uncharacterized protein EJ110_NYTH40376 [Nymphaea thermarum]|nr:Uncharacterized protein EJ110_NYTH40376 [Nymphaea thermarum]